MKSNELFRVERLRVRSASRNLIRCGELAVEKGERLALLGSSGSGKTLFLLTVLRLVHHLHPDLIVEGSLGGFLESSRVGYVPQGTEGHLHPQIQIGRQVRDLVSAARREVPERLGNRPEEMFVRLGLEPVDEIVRMYPRQLSGGMRQRVLIAIALLCEPDLLVMDEPTTALDGLSRSLVHAAIDEHLDSTGATLLLATHSIREARLLANQFLTIEEGEIRQSTDSATPARLAIDEKLGVRAHLSTQGRSQLLEASDVWVTAGSPGHEKPLVTNFACTLAAGGSMGLIGETGAGKTTALRALGCLVPLARGCVRLEGTEISSLGEERIRSWRRRFQFVFQDPSIGLNPWATVAELFIEPSHIYSHPPPETSEIVDALSALGLKDDLLQRRPSQLSFGQRQRVALARVLLSFPQLELLFLDEPLTGLDPFSWRQTLEFLLRFKGRIGFVVACHDLDLVQLLCDQVIVLRNGSIVEYTSPGSTSPGSISVSHPYSQLLWRSWFVENREELRTVEEAARRVSVTG